MSNFGPSIRKYLYVLHTELTAILASYAPSAHSHPISDVTGLQAALDDAGGTPAGNNQAVQFNDNGAFGASDNLFTDGSILSLLPTSSANRIVNGNFDSSSANWTLGTGWTYSAGKVRKTSNGTGVLGQSFTVGRGELYKVVYTISDWTAGTISPTLGGVSMPTVSANGTYTEYVFTTNSAPIAFSPSNTSRFSIDDVSVFNMSGGIIRTGGLQIVGQSVISRATSSSSLGNNSHLSLQNPSGGNSYIDSYFGNSFRSAIGFSSAGSIQLIQTGGSGIEFFSGIFPPILSAYLTATIFLHYGNGSFGGSVSIGQNQTAPPSTKTVYGSSGEKWEYLTAGTVLTGAYTYVHANADESSSCSGTITHPCSFWTTQADCEKWNAHGGCGWNAGNPCSSYNEEFGMGSCAGQAGCTVELGECGGAGDDYSCTQQNDAFGGNCVWGTTPQDCGGFDEMDCGNYGGCSTNYDSCANYNDGGGDGYSCNIANGGGWCSYDDGTGECSGNDWFTGCTGSWDADSCTGEFNTGQCLGSYGSGCFGTSMCGGITTSPNCGFEPGCDWISGVTLQFPLDTGVAFYRSYFIRNVAVTANVTMIPNTHQTVNDTTSNLITPGKSKHYSFVFISLPCGTFSGTNESTCLTGHPGCGWNIEELACSQFGTEETCTPSGCSWDGMDCSGVYPANTCEGNWTYKRDWSIFAEY